MQSETLGRYRIVKELGRGAMGRVFLAHDPTIDRQVAIKTIQIFAALPQAEREQARGRFLREARAAGKLLHPGIVTIFDVGEAEGVPYLAMEYVEGTTLDAYARPDTLLPAATALEIAAGAAEALAFAHRAGIVHRDVKPANLMRVGEASLKVMDFGLARGAESQITQDGGLLGTPSYMSPEQIRGEELDGRSDLFSLAAVLYELLTGAKAFPGDSVSAIIFRVVNDDPRDVTDQAASLPPVPAVLLRRALAKQREQRFPDGDAFAAALREAAAKLSAAPESSETPAPAAAPEVLPPPPRRIGGARRRRRARWAFLLTVLLLLAGGAAGWQFRDRIREFVTPPPKTVWLEAAVRTDPPGLPVTLDGVPLDEPTVRFQAQGPFGTLATVQGCRTVEHVLEPADGGREIALVPDPVEAELTVDAGVPGAQVSLNGERAGVSPAAVRLDLCRDNELEVRADGYREATLRIPAAATPLEARTAVATLRPEAIPRGRLVLDKPAVPVLLYVDGAEVRPGGDGVELEEGRHRVRAVNRKLWIDVTQTVEITGDETRRLAVELPGIAELVVQAFPANGEVHVRRPGGKWTHAGDVPARYELAAGRYEVKVVFKPGGEERVREVELAPGANPPVRIAFGRDG